MYDCMVSPVMDYSAAIWGFKEYACFNTTQHRAMRTFLGVGRQAPIAAMYSDTKWCPPHVRHKLAVVRYWSKLTRMPECRLPRRIFEWDFNLALRKKPCWSTDVLKILKNYDLEEHFSREGWHLFDSFKLSNCVNDKLMSNWCEIQKDRSADMSRMKLFYEISNFYESNKPQPYINIRDRKKRSMLAKLRTGTLPLKIETGRYRYIPEHQRICVNCDLNVIEHEKHFIFYCTKHDNIRNDLLNHILDNDNNDIENLKMIFMDFEKSKDLASSVLFQPPFRRLSVLVPYLHNGRHLELNIVTNCPFC